MPRLKFFSPFFASATSGEARRKATMRSATKERARAKDFISDLTLGNAASLAGRRDSRCVASNLKKDAGNERNSDAGEGRLKFRAPAKLLPAGPAAAILPGGRR